MQGSGVRGILPHPTSSISNIDHMERDVRHEDPHKVPSLPSGVTFVPRPFFDGLITYISSYIRVDHKLADAGRRVSRDKAPVEM
jgi:hypothetical protein